MDEESEILEEAEPTISRAGQQWLSLMAASDGALICGAFGLPFPVDPESEDIPTALALMDLGVCSARVVREPREKGRTIKARHAWESDETVVDLAPRWRFADPNVETGESAIVLPVRSARMGEWNSSAFTPPGAAVTSSLARCGDESFAADVVDLIAIPLNGGRPLSATGLTTAVGAWLPDERGSLGIFASGLGWLNRHLGRARKIAEETPPHLVAKLYVPFPDPEGVLMLEPRALEWRVTKTDCVVPPAARRVVCPDSRVLAELIDGLVRRRERARPLPVVCGPKEEAA